MLHEPLEVRMQWFASCLLPAFAGGMTLELAVVATSYVVAGPLAAASLAPAATLSLVAIAATAAALPFSLRRLGVIPSSGPLGRPW